jgi:hypothetical protein
MACKEKGRKHDRWMEMLQGNTTQLQYLVMPKVQITSVDNYKEKRIISGQTFY